MDPLDAVAAAIADGTPPDWEAARAAARTDEDRAALEHLRHIAEFGSGSISPGNLLTPDVAEGEQAPALWGTLQVRERVGRGRFGDVYRAWDPALDRDVALKLLHSRDTSESAAVVDEGRLMARVRHPNIVTIYGAQRIDGRVGLSMEFIHGHTLADELRERGPLDAAGVGTIGIALARALAAVHDTGLVHRDIKPSNVLRENTGRIVLGDFGTGQELDQSESERVGLTGTPAYLAPEIFEHAPATPPSDLYSLGALLFHLLTGTHPVPGATIGEIRRAHQRGTRLQLKELGKICPRACHRRFSVLSNEIRRRDLRTLEPWRRRWRLDARGADATTPGCRCWSARRGRCDRRRRRLSEQAVAHDPRLPGRSQADRRIQYPGARARRSFRSLHGARRRCRRDL